MPFEVISALSRDPELLRQWSRLGLGVLLLAASLGSAQENPPPAPPISDSPSAPAAIVVRSTNVVAVDAATNAVAPTTVVVAPPTPAAESSTSTNPAPATAATAKPPTPTSSKPGGAVPPNSYEAFKIVSDRNIFNPNRYPSRSRGGPVEAPKPPPKIESFALVGTISYDKGAFAFFDSNSSSYRKTLKAGDTIANYQLKEVAQSHVTLAADGKETELKVGMQMRRENEGPWQASARTESFGSSSTGSAITSGSSGSPEAGASSGSSSTSAVSSSTSDSGGASDLLKRLMEKRMKEQNK